MKHTEVQLPDAIYQQVEDLANELRLTVPEMLRRAAEQMVLRRATHPPRSNGAWRFPEGRHLGAFRARVEEWRLLANEAAD